MRVGRKRHLALVIHRPHTRAAHPNTPATEGDLAILVAMTKRRPLEIVAALRADDIHDLLLHQLAQDAKPDTNAQREQALLRSPNQLPQRLLHAHRQNSFLRGRLRDRYVLIHGGSDEKVNPLGPIRSATNSSYSDCAASRSRRSWSVRLGTCTRVPRSPARSWRARSLLAVRRGEACR
jgi:hypothetical protein